MNDIQKRPDDEALPMILDRLAQLRSDAQPWDGPPGYTMLRLEGAYICFADPANTDNYLTVVYSSNERDADGHDALLFTVTADLEYVGDWVRGEWEARLFEPVAVQ